MKTKTLALTTLFFSASMAFAHDAGPEEQAVVNKIHAVNQMEIQIGNMAGDKAQDKKVKGYGDKLVKDHRAADKKVASYAKKHNIQLAAPEPSADDKALMAKLEKATGADFDREFTASMHEGHSKVIGTLNEAKADAGPELKKLIDGLMPGLVKHEKTAEALHKSAEAR